MSVKNKRVISTVVYYTLAVLALAMAGFFIFALVVKGVALWAKIIYFIWIGLVIGAIIFDIICTSAGEAKMISAIIIYVLSMLAVIMACILYAMNTGATGLGTDFFNLFVSISAVSLMTTGYMIATWCVGESLVEHASANKEISERKKNS